MKCESYQQFVIVEADTAALLTDQLNATIKRLRGKRPVADIKSGRLAIVSYTEDSFDPEDIGEALELEGLKITCQDCPLFTPIYKADGTEDRRIKYGNCPECNFGRTYRTSRPCEKLFKMINNGEVKLCLSTE